MLARTIGQSGSAGGLRDEELRAGDDPAPRLIACELEAPFAVHESSHEAARIAGAPLERYIGVGRADPGEGRMGH
jgi:hypothetical protein